MRKYHIFRHGKDIFLYKVFKKYINPKPLKILTFTHFFEVKETLIDPPYKDINTRFTTVPLNTCLFSFVVSL